jgi:hypothetical protein
MRVERLLRVEMQGLKDIERRKANPSSISRFKDVSGPAA